MEITVRLEDHFGGDYIYPVDDKAKLFARIHGTKTLSRRTLDLIKQLGYSVKFEEPETNV